ncbi:MAG: hypothetical protein IKD90_09200 [Clostridiales bacterium]|nr:hypothetical protein [Clostridiales bacterium]
MSEAQSNPSKIDLSIVQPYTPTEAQIKKYTSCKIKSACTFLFGSLILLVAVIALILLFIHVFHIIVYSVKIIIFLLLVLCLPLYAVFNIFSTLKNIGKKNYSFYTGKILGKNEKGYMVSGIAVSDLSFIDKTDSDAERAPGAPVIIAVMKDDFDLLGMD